MKREKNITPITKSYKVKQNCFYWKHILKNKEMHLEIHKIIENLI